MDKACVRGTGTTRGPSERVCGRILEIDAINKCQNADAQVLKWKLKNGKGVTVEIGKNGKVLVNKKPGAKANNSNAAGMGLTCYAADADKREQFCSTNY